MEINNKKSGICKHDNCTKSAIYGNLVDKKIMYCVLPIKDQMMLMLNIKMCI